MVSDEKDSEGNKVTVGVIQPPMLQDNTGKLSVNNKLKIEKQENGQYRLEVLLDKEFINNQETESPLILVIVANNVDVL